MEFSKNKCEYQLHKLSLEEPKYKAFLIFIAWTFSLSLCHVVTSLKSNELIVPPVLPGHTWRTEYYNIIYPYPLLPKLWFQRQGG